MDTSIVESASKQGLCISREAADQQGKNSWSLVLYTKSSRAFYLSDLLGLGLSICSSGSQMI